MPIVGRKIQRIYLIGAKGVGMTMLAQFLAAKGNLVSGSDVKDTFLTDKVLRASKIRVFSPFAARNIPADLDLIIYSTAYDARNNPEMAFIASRPARFKNVRILSYPEALGEIFNQYYGVAVCGSHGKTTTSAWLGYVLWRAGQKPNVLVGSSVPQFKGSGLSGASRYFIAEADEYQNKLQYFKPRGVVLNNIDYDHPDFFKTAAAYTKVFAEFIKKIPAAGFLVINGRDRESQKIKKDCRGRVISYDLVDGDRIGVGRVDYLATDLRLKNGWQIFRVSARNRTSAGRKNLGDFKIALWGEHNILNALAVIAAARELKVPLAALKKHLAGFTGTQRRAQILGCYHGALVIDDYAHHPTEIQATLKGLRERYKTKKIITVFHPHTFTRTKVFFRDFVRSFVATDELIILDIYSSARESGGRKRGRVSSRELAQAIVRFNQAGKVRTLGRKQVVRHIATMTAAAAYLRQKLKPGNVLLLMGAGDVFRIGTALLKKKDK
jgi:UDP-N-acetylmuramate--alanine ligase